jgi:hypothetical protein
MLTSYQQENYTKLQRLYVSLYLIKLNGIIRYSPITYIHYTKIIQTKQNKTKQNLLKVVNNLIFN